MLTFLNCDDGREARDGRVSGRTVAMAGRHDGRQEPFSQPQPAMSRIDLPLILLGFRWATSPAAEVRRSNRLPARGRVPQPMDKIVPRSL